MRRDELDTPARPGLPPRLDPRAGSPARRDADGGGRRLVWTGRVTAGLLSLALLVTSGWGWYLGQVAGASVARTDAIPTSGNDQTVTTGAAMNLLLVGNDSRAALTDEQLAEFKAGADAGTNTDTMILVHVPADGSKASFVSFPRDSFVQIPGHGQAKLNAAYAYGRQDAPESATEEEKSAKGAQLLVQTLSQLTGLRIDHYAEVDLLGFFELSNVVGGVEVNLCQAVDDRKWSGAVFPAGPQTITGADALKFVRQRHNIGKTSSDFDRIRRQQVFLAGVLRKMLSEDVLRDLGTQHELVEAVSEALTVDADLDLMELAQQMQSVTAGSIEFQTVPNEGVDSDEDAGSIIRLADAATLRAFFTDLSAEPAPATPEAAPATPEAPAPTAAPADVAVEVLNGSGTSGLAGKAAAGLTAAGFQVTGTGNADSMGHDVTEVRFAAGDDALAAALAAQVPGAVTQQADDATSGTVQLVLGADYNGVGKAVSPAAPVAAAETPAEPPRTAADTSCIN
ncbi:LytR family transcriptional regulator [Modestobacter muralis]|uniref:LytR family transcriptional regulator n=1 Tax=Modestobacter muralis TaxID=1608614 RepID=A0A6P0HCQ4_9ACTN|nr:LCP family protein [Modestobacter muralis]NEK96065.1 LytR family transcriptional regulator [Modestobacter muralis]NEN52953.1 LytR family transcriptional regulator [Modestobacter muralis]